jgi:hypothetical protein
MQFYIKEALRLFGSSHTDPDILLAEKLLLWAQHHEKIYLIHAAATFASFLIFRGRSISESTFCRMVWK